MAADALAVPPAAVSAALHAAFRRARELQLTLEDVEAALGQAPDAAPPGATGTQGRASRASEAG